MKSLEDLLVRLLVLATVAAVLVAGHALRKML
jgi:hypothetical protein